MSEEIKQQSAESMEDFAQELEASYKEFAERQKQVYVEDENPDAEKWQEIKQMEVDKVSIKVKIKEIVRGGAIAYVDEIKGFIPASQLSASYVEDLDEWVGKHLEVRVITADPAAKKLVLSAREILREKEAEERAEKLAACKVGSVLEGTVDSIKPYGAFITLSNGLSGLVHISQISRNRIKHPGVVLEEGQNVTVKVIGIQDGKISLSMKELEEQEPAETEVFDYDEKGQATTGLGDLLKGFKF